MLVKVKEILKSAQRKKGAVGAFNVSDLITAQAVVFAAVKLKKPAIVQITKSTLEYAGDVEIVNLVRNMIQERSKNIPMGINLDHGREFDLCKRAVSLGFTGVMIDGSTLSYEENKNLTAKVVTMAHKKQITVQGELGTVPYLGKHQVPSGTNGEWDKFMTDPLQAAEFVKNTGVDSLAVGIGNAHGFQKERDVPDWRRLKKINELVKVPLVLHGASDWSGPKVKKAVERGICCFNIDTDIRLAYINKLCAAFENGCVLEDPRKIMVVVRNHIQKKVEEKMRMFCCE